MAMIAQAVETMYADQHIVALTWFEATLLDVMLECLIQARKKKAVRSSAPSRGVPTSEIFRGACKQ